MSVRVAKAAVFNVLCFASVAGCMGNVPQKSGSEGETPDDDGSNDGSGGSGTSNQPDLKPDSTVAEAAPARIRRLNDVEIKNSLRDIFQVELRQSFTSDLQRHDFDNQFETLGFTPDLAAALQGAAEEVSQSLGNKVVALADCDPAKSNEATCAETFINRIGRRLYRRPLSETERANLVGLFTEVRRGRDYAIAVATVIEAMIQSPQFVFRTELGTSAGQKLATLSPFEIASWLSFGLWRSTPDDALLDAAAGGGLSTRKGIEEQAKRLIGEARGKAAFRDFVLQWLDMAEPEALRKSDPAFKDTTTASMISETTKFFEDIVWNGEGSFQSLMTAKTAYANGELAALYGINVDEPNSFSKAAVPATERAGFLTLPGFIAAHMPGGDTSPISVGRFVRVAMLCQPLPPPPAGVPEVSQAPALTTRQRYAQHSQDVRCSGCHTLIDPIGFGFEKYDVMGRYRQSEKGMSLTGKGELHESDVDGPFTGAVELAERLSKSPSVESCFAAHMLKFLLGRDTANPSFRLPIDEKTLELAVEKSRKEGALDVRELAIALATSDAGLLRNSTNVLENDKENP